MAIDDIKAAWEVVKKTASLESQETIMDLRENHLSLREEILQLKEENSRLKSEAENKEKLVYEAPYYWKIDGDVKDGPLCQLCYDNSKKEIRLQKTQQQGLWICKNCKETFSDRNYKSPEPDKAITSYHPYDNL